MTVGDLDLDACSREPIHRPGSIQPHGMLLAFSGSDAGAPLIQASANAALALSLPLEQALGLPLERALHPQIAAAARSFLAAGPVPSRPVPVVLTELPGAGRHQLLAHAVDDAAGNRVVILELERLDGLETDLLDHVYPRMREALERLDALNAPTDLLSCAAQEVRALTGFDRVLIYRFDADWHGTVVAEDGNGRLPSYMDLRFPASDIPTQARELYRLNRQRLIPDAGYAPVPLVALPPALEGALPLDLSFSVLRSVSPVHVQYMRNMETASSMSVSVLLHGALWGLVSCHHHEPKAVSYAVRSACDLIAQILSVRIAAVEDRRDAEHRIALQAIQARLLAAMAQADPFITGLTEHPDDLLRFANASGAAVVFERRCTLVGDTPTEEQVRGLVDWLATQGEPEQFETDSLPALYPAAADFEGKAAGLLAVAVSKLHASYVLWFRPEVVRTVRWGGDPRKPLGREGQGQGQGLSPRTSFETWKETVRHRALPWTAAERDTAAALRHAVIGIVLRKAEELASLSRELARSNKELESFSYSVSHDLRAPFRHIVGYAELLQELEADQLSETGKRYLDVIVDAANSAGTLVDNLLHFSQMGRSELTPVSMDMNALVAEVRETLAPDTAGRAIEWDIAPLPTVRGDPVMMRLVLQNLLSNAIKYSRGREPARIAVGCEDRPTETIFFVRDNGVGFNQAYEKKLFGVFQRLHRNEEFEGIGIGLANVRRAVDRHGGRTWADGRLDKGAIFYFTLPKAGTAKPDLRDLDE
ncbi:ATPase (plasmid) [Azospirillum baldaniorum]|uniref:histidine kinase n=2 Tax=Azospirillum baldaniorum TaxID=1064539 RepID=A0A9P1NRS9_9PROT|nr:ATP-binding protein [Azospirillum baldaniorum]AWJ94921.1 ATPase [Azospirillum baldaniorum]TWA75008.1 light-regulated signal transduction histidine kinase (bacteriophytochrome) [Azospirillum brasilense]CCD03362.1 sensor protein [Azospirillum baldaniorum]